MKNILLLTMTLMSILSLTSCNKETREKKVIYRPVSFLKVALNQDTTELYYSGKVKAANRKSLSFRKTGTISAVNIKVGDHVKKNQVLSTLDHTQTNLSIDKAKANKESLYALLQIAKSNFFRIQNLYSFDHISLNDLELAKSKLSSAKANYLSASKELKLLQEDLIYESIVAPQDGVIAEVLFENQENITPGTTTITMNAGEELEVILNLPDEIINKIERGAKLRLQIPATQREGLIGIVSEIAPNIDNNTGLYPVTIKIDSTPKGLREGMVAKVKIDTDILGQHNEVRLPITSIISDQNKHFVYLLNPINDSVAVVIRKPIVLGKNHRHGITIKSGIEKGDLIVTAGLQTLMEHQKVLIK
ncbi:efflux RND transporter periplasmic adaptor subunit [Halosquirtibacter laminarini]|uniref:Efflux RND transporter periplasmic adaptor subunit n=1 Tax=Halosquirtibacter laminarini TaxID=3374600 RepID=A0AC61NQZ1_9BACT|nr:efflux RND transporter periplasmic adaptor subunit [Prolixibacteraceae bacterium]